MSEESPFAKAGPSDANRGGIVGDPDASSPMYSDTSPRQQMLERGLFAAVKANALLTVILCIVRAFARPVNAGLYIMYALFLLLLVGLELYIVQLVRLGEINGNRRWFLYMFVIFVFVECVCTDIAIFQ